MADREMITSPCCVKLFLCPYQRLVWFLFDVKSIERIALKRHRMAKRNHIKEVVPCLRMSYWPGFRKCHSGKDYIPYPCTEKKDVQKALDFPKKRMIQ